jgi:hypothetical protein
MPPSADWDPLGSSNDAFYRRTSLYDLTWSFPNGGDLSDYVIVGASNGGPIALTRDESKPVLLSSGGIDNASSKSKRVSVYNSAGILMQSIIVGIIDYLSCVYSLATTG